jgi:hypothetical protein
VIEHGTASRIAAPLTEPVEHPQPERLAPPAFSQEAPGDPQQPREGLVAFGDLTDVPPGIQERLGDHILSRTRRAAPPVGIAQEREIVNFYQS